MTAVNYNNRLASLCNAATLIESQPTYYPHNHQDNHVQTWSLVEDHAIRWFIELPEEERPYSVDNFLTLFLPQKTRDAYDQKVVELQAEFVEQEHLGLSTLDRNEETLVARTYSPFQQNEASEQIKTRIPRIFWTINELKKGEELKPLYHSLSENEFTQLLQENLPNRTYYAYTRRIIHPERPLPSSPDFVNETKEKKITWNDDEVNYLISVIPRFCNPNQVSLVKCSKDNRNLLKKQFPARSAHACAQKIRSLLRKRPELLQSSTLTAKESPLSSTSTF